MSTASTDTTTPAADVPEALKAGTLHWLEVAALGVAIAISGNVSGWNYGLAVGGWGGMLIAALAMAVLFLCLTQSVAELAAVTGAGGFDGYVRRGLGVTGGYLAGISVAVALAIGTGLAASFAAAYVAGWLGFGGWPIKLIFVAIVLGLQLRGAQEAVGLTVVVGVAALVIILAFCIFVASAFNAQRLLSHVPDGQLSLFPHGVAGVAGCIPFALFLFLGVEQSAHAAAEMRDVPRSMPKALATAIGVAFVIGMCVLLIATGATGAERLAVADDPLYAAVAAQSVRSGRTVMEYLVGVGAPLSLLGTVFSLAYAGSRQFYHLAQATYLPAGLGRVNRRQAPAAAVWLVGAFALVTAAFPPSSAMVVFIFLISLSHVLLLATLIRLRRAEPALVRPYRALGGAPVAVLGLALSVAVMVSCYWLEPRALTIAIGLSILLTAEFRWLRAARFTR